MEPHSYSPSPRSRWPGSYGPARLAFATATLVVLGMFAFFANSVDNFPGEVGATSWVQSWQAPWVETVMKAISAPGELLVAGPLLLALSVAMYVWGWRYEGALLLSVSVVGRIVGLVLKEIVARPRPADGLVNVLQEADGYSFPSAHAMHYAVFLGTVAVILAAKAAPSVALYVAYAALFAALVAMGVSRVYLGAHWPGDVLAGYAYGAAVVATATWLWRRWSASLDESLVRSH